MLVGVRLLGVRLLGCLLLPLLLPLLQRGHGDTEYGDLEEEGHYLYMDEDGPLEVLGGPARCQDTYQDWISVYCWAPFHAALMATPEGSRCHWDQISRGSRRPAGGSSGSNKEQDQGGSNPAAPGAPGPDGFQMRPLACERSCGALESWPREGRAALPRHLPGSTTPGEIIFPQQGGSLGAELHQAPIDAWAVKGEALASRSALGQRCNELTRPQPRPQGAGVVLGAGGHGPHGWELCQERGAPAEPGGAGGWRQG